MRQICVSVQETKYRDDGGSRQQVARLVLLAKDRGLRQRWKAAVAPARLARAGSLARRQ